MNSPDIIEKNRLTALHQYQLLDTPPDGAFDNITALAAKFLKVPIAIVSLVDTDRIWFKSHHGLEVAEIDRVPGLCASAILSNLPYILSDASLDPRSLSNPLVAGDFGLRFYAAIPLITHDDYNLGTLCVLDFEPRIISDDDIHTLTCLAKAVMDHMELKLAARRLKEAHQETDKNNRLASAVFESSQSMYVTDTEGYFMDANQTFLDKTGYSMTDLVGQTAEILKSGRHDAAFYKNKWSVLISTGFWAGELWHKKKNHDSYLELVNIIAVKDENACVTHYVFNCTDIGALKAYELGLIDAKENAERFSTLKSQFIASMSHEIRTPMTAIIGFSTLALYEDMPDQIRTYLQDINSASTSLLGILQDVLDFTKLEVGRVVIEAIPFNVLDLLNTIDTLFTGSAQQKGLTFTINRDSATPLELIGDKLRLQQVLTNLVGNALKFTAQGSVKLELSLQSINLSQAQVLFTVTDTGIGIALEDQDKLFVEFSQVDGSFTRQYGGTGLGLVISKELVELMGGEISVVSVKNQGSAFSFAVQFDINNLSTSHTTDYKVISQKAPSKPYET